MAEVKTCIVDINHGKKRLECRQGMTLFAGLRTHKLYMPTGCGARGICGQCKVKLLDGPANLMTDSEVKLIPEDERAAGTRLACQLRLSGDISVQLRDYIFGARPYTVTVADITPLTYDIKRFSFALEPGERVEHQAGQFVNLMVKIPGTNVQAVRCFSFTTPSSVDDRVDIIVKLNPKGVMTPYMFEQVKPGDTMTMLAPFGDFHLHGGDEPCIWIGGGSGLSPFMGMLQELVDTGNTTRQVRLFFGAVKPNDLYYVELLNDLAARYPWFSFIPALSGDERSEYCRDYGLVTDVVAKYVEDASSCQGYLCGSPGMIGACLKVLVDRGMARDNIFYDRF